MGETIDGGYFSDDLKLYYFRKKWRADKSSNVKCKFPEKAKWLKETVLGNSEANPLIMIAYPKR